MKTLLIFIVLLTITGCASTSNNASNTEQVKERYRIMEQAKMDRDSGKITSEQYSKIVMSIVDSMPYHNRQPVVSAVYVPDNTSAVLLDYSARMFGGGYGYNQPIRMQTTCTQIGMFTQCW